jgi:O-antigen polymerase
MFEHDYNLQQANYFAGTNAAAGEIENASFTHMAYNEFLQNAVEGGVTGLLLFAAFLFALLLPVKMLSLLSNENVAALAGVLAFILMSVVNFTIQAIPLMPVLMTYTAVICLQTKFNNSKMMMYNFTKPVFGLLLIVVGIGIFSSQISRAAAFAKINTAGILIKENNNEEALQILLPLKKSMEHEIFYSTTLGKAYVNQKKIQQALYQFQRSSQFSSSPALLANICNCQLKLKQYDKALATLQTASNMVPNRLTPKYCLMKTYMEINDTTNAHKMAVVLIAMKPKGISKNAAKFKQEANEILKESYTRYLNNQNSVTNND